jgi:NAD(P)-dependent dehydrogenase (short-subunit alcohol dehydrogenase family)
MDDAEVALVTGANKGIGKQIVRRLAAEGMIVYLGARDRRRGEAAARELADDGLDVRVLELDVTVQEQVAAAAATIDAECGRLDVLVNNAGVILEWDVPTTEVTADHMRATFEVNVFGTVAMTQACIPLLRRSKASRVVNMSSAVGSLSLLSDPRHPISSLGLLAYSSSKAALNAVSLVYAAALREANIRVNVASPGLVATDLNSGAKYSRGDRTPQDAAEIPVRLALGVDRITGAFRGGEMGHSVDDTVPW